MTNIETQPWLQPMIQRNRLYIYIASFSVMNANIITIRSFFFILKDYSTNSMIRNNLYQYSRSVLICKGAISWDFVKSKMDVLWSKLTVYRLKYWPLHAWKWTIMYRTGRFKALKLDSVSKWTVLKAKKLTIKMTKICPLWYRWPPAIVLDDPMMQMTVQFCPRPFLF